MATDSVRELQTRARAVIGTQGDDDYVLDPTKHAAEYAESAPEFSDLLGSARLSIIAKRYKQRDDQAGEAQQEYKWAVERANLAVLATAVFSALMMAAQIVSGEWSLPPWTIGALGLLSALCGALATMWLYAVRQGKLLERWMTARANAETARLSYFTAVAEPGDAPPDAALDLLKLEYFCRYQYDVQTSYYRNRGRKHDQAARRNLSIGSAAVLLSAGAAGISGVVGATTNGTATAFGALGVIGAALASYAAARETVSQDQRNAERYDRTHTALESIGGERLDRVRTAVAQGNAQALIEFVAAVNEQISLEHRQWVESSEATKAAVAKLEDSLQGSDGAKKT
jgi:hypothetical protein